HARLQLPGATPGGDARENAPVGLAGTTPFRLSGRRGQGTFQSKKLILLGYPMSTTQHPLREIFHKVGAGLFGDGNALLEMMRTPAPAILSRGVRFRTPALRDD